MECTLTGMRVHLREMRSMGIGISIRIRICICIRISISTSLRIPQFPEYEIVFVLRSVEASLALLLSPSHCPSPFSQAAPFPRSGQSDRALVGPFSPDAPRRLPVRMPLLSRFSAEEALLPSSLSFPRSLSLPCPWAMTHDSWPMSHDSWAMGHGQFSFHAFE
jgi:hypothetical protein